MTEQKEVASQCKQNCKKFWKYVNSKCKLKSSVGDSKTVDIHGNTRLITKDEEKANTQHQDIVYDFKAEIRGTGSRSLY